MKNFICVIMLTLFFACSKTPDPAPAPIVPEESTELKYSTGYIKDDAPKYGKMFFAPAARKYPPDFSWEDEGFETPVRNQGNCGSCWAFGGTQAIEMGYKIFAHKEIDFSEQDLVSTMFYGCGGGNHVFNRQVEKGQMAEADCPYTASGRKCPNPFKAAGKPLSGGYVGQENRRPTDEELQAAITNYGALSVTVGANGSFGNLDGGFAKGCPSVGTNHIVALTGWKTNPADGKIYFKIKNSWGTGWGKDGYSFVRRGCWNLAEDATFVVVEKAPCPPPAVKLPAEYVLHYQDEVLLSVKNIPGVTYAWFREKEKIGDASSLEVYAQESMVLKLVAKNQCGSAEIQTKITVTQ